MQKIVRRSDFPDSSSDAIAPGPVRRLEQMAVELGFGGGSPGRPEFTLKPVISETQRFKFRVPVFLDVSGVSSKPTVRF